MAKFLDPKILLVVIFLSIMAIYAYITFINIKECPARFQDLLEPILAKNIITGQTKSFLHPCTISAGWKTIEE